MSEWQAWAVVVGVGLLVLIVFYIYAAVERIRDTASNMDGHLRALRDTCDRMDSEVQGMGASLYTVKDDISDLQQRIKERAPTQDEIPPWEGGRGAA